MLTRREGKYTSAPPRCTCLPTCQHCTEVALGGAQVHCCQVHLGQVEVQLGFASLNFNLASMDLASMYLCCSSCNFSSRPPRPSPSSTRLRLVELGLGLSGLEWSQRWSTSCNFSQVHLGQVEVQLGFASLDFNLASMDLIGVCGGSPRATPMKSNFGPVEVQLGFASLDFNLTEIGLQPKSVKSNTYYRWT